MTPDDACDAGVHKPMDLEVRDPWVEALRSGKYDQGQNYLRESSGQAAKHCCLGVLCDIVDYAEWDDDDHVWPPGVRRQGVMPGYCVLPDWILEPVQLSQQAQDHLIDMNDGNRPFSEIADWIEANL